MKKIDVETPSDPMGWWCTERDRPVGSLDGKSKQRKKEEIGRKRKKRGWGGGSSSPAA